MDLYTNSLFTRMSLPAVIKHKIPERLVRGIPAAKGLSCS